MSLARRAPGAAVSAAALACRQCGRLLGLALLAACALAPSLAAQSPSAADARADTTGRATAARGLPLETARIIEFTTREATWLSLDVTPDGRTIVFELLGDLYTLPITGGTATRITEGLGYDAQPRVSPDGEWLAFISDRDGADNLWIARIDGRDARKLSSETQIPLLSPTWTPDGRYVLVSRRANPAEFRMYHVDGGSGVTLPAPTSAGAAPGAPPARPAGSGPVFSPDGRYLYYSRPPAGGGAFPTHQIARRDMVSGDIDIITQAEWSAMRPLVSPDGRLLVYGTRHRAQTGLRVRDLQTGDDRWLIWPIQRDDAESSAASRDLLPGYAFTPDGREVVVTFDGGIHAVSVATGASRAIPFEAAVRLDAGPELRTPYRIDDGPVRARLVQTPRFSPDNRRVVFSVLTRLYAVDVVAADTSNEATLHVAPTPRALTPEGVRAFQPAWSPDGRWIAYVTWETDGGHIWRIAADGRGRPERLTNVAAFYTDLVWSPDGSRIVALRGNAFMRNQTFSEFGGLRIPLDVVWLPADGGDVSLVAPARGVGTPHFGGDADRIYVYSRDGLQSLRFDGTDRRTHLRVTGRPNPRAPQPPTAAAVIMRPGGGHALASSEGQLYVLAVPPTGGDAPSVAVTGGGVPVRRITDIGADYFGWSDDGASLYWAIGSSVFRRAFDSIVWRDEPAARDTAARRGAAAPDSAAAPGAPADSIAPAAPADSAAAAAPGDSVAARGTAAADSARRAILRDREPHVQRIDVVLEFPRARPAGTIVLRNARIISMRGDEIIERGDVVVTDNRIAAVGSSGSVSVPPGANELDVAGRTMVPGFIDTHAHWEFRTRDVLEPHNWSLLANLAYGVTAGLDVQTSTNDYFAYQDMIDTGMAIGQRAFMTGPGIFSRNDFRSYDEVEAFLARYREHYRTPNIKSYMVGNRQQRQWVVNASRKLGLMPTTEGGRDMKLDITHAIDGMHGNEHTLPVTPIYDDVVQLYARTGIAYTPTLLVLYGGISAIEWWLQRENPHADPKLNRFYPSNWLAQLTRRRSSWAIDEEHNFRAAALAAAQIQRAGGLIGVGGHGEVQGLGYHWEMWSLAMGGMTPREVLRAATIDGARIIGFEQDLGSIEPGKLADLVILDADPLADIRNTNTVRWVMKNGELYDGDTLAQLWPVQRPLPRLWWWGEEAPPRR
jgi:Tol biopolymer transport system component